MFFQTAILFFRTETRKKIILAFSSSHLQETVSERVYWLSERLPNLSGAFEQKN
jgi:hypothetical protein